MCFDKLENTFEDEYDVYNTIRGYQGKGLKFEMCFNGPKAECVKYPHVIGKTKTETAKTEPETAKTEL